MKIIYITTALEKNDYVEFCQKWTIALNSSNQNFHNKMIRSLALSNEISVLSTRPFSKKKCLSKKLTSIEKYDHNITWHYLDVKHNRFLRHHSFKKEAKNIINREEPAVVLVDTINPNTILLANYVKRKFHFPVIGICTDSPSNITGTSRSYTLLLLSQSKNLDGYICLTEGLNFLFNQNNKPYIVMPGLVEDEVTNYHPVNYQNYFFFGGALLKRYGVYQLIEAFKSLNHPEINLLICGHHGDESALSAAINGASNIHYLGCLPVDEVLNYESQAIANINPRPYSEDLDRFSIPSKTLEYLSSNRLTISIKNTELEKDFHDYALWGESGQIIDLQKAMELAIKMSEEERNELAKKAKNVIKDKYSLSAVNKKLTNFLMSFFK